MTPNLESLASGLSEAQRRAIMTARTDGDGEYYFRLGTARGIPSELKQRGFECTWLTPLGLELRQYLISRARGEGEL